MKELKIRPQIADNDLKIAAKKTKKWFLKGKRVKVVVSFKGRQNSIIDELGMKTLWRFLAILGEYKMINAPQRNGKKVFMVIC